MLFRCIRSREGNRWEERENHLRLAGHDTPGVLGCLRIVISNSRTCYKNSSEVKLYILNLRPWIITYPGLRRLKQAGQVNWQSSSLCHYPVFRLLILRYIQSGIV